MSSRFVPSSGVRAAALRGRRRDRLTGDTAWTSAITEAAAGADLLVAESYHFTKDIPFHLDHRTLVEHRAELDCARIVLTHLSEDMLGHLGEAGFEVAHDGLALHLKPTGPER